MPALGTFIAGPYTATYDGLTLGLLDPQGTGRDIRLRCEDFGHDIQGHTYGLTWLDGVSQGGNHYIDFIANEQLKAVLKAYWPHSATVVGSYSFQDLFNLSGIGRLYSSLGATLVLTAVAGTTAASASNGPVTLTGLVYPTPQTREIIMGTELRRFPVSFRFIPQDYSGTVRHALVT